MFRKKYIFSFSFLRICVLDVNMNNAILSYHCAGSRSGRPHRASWCCHKEGLLG